MTARPCDSGRRDALGRPIKVAAGDTEQRSTAPAPAATYDTYDNDDTYDDDDGDDGDDVCRQCGGANDDGEGWDGLCGNCADIDTQLEELGDTFEDLNRAGRRQALIDWLNDRYPNSRPGDQIVDGLIAEHGGPRAALRELRDQMPALDSAWTDNLATRTLNAGMQTTPDDLTWENMGHDGDGAEDQSCVLRGTDGCHAEIGPDGRPGTPWSWTIVNSEGEDVDSGSGDSEADVKAAVAAWHASHKVTMWDDLSDYAKASWRDGNFAPAEAAMWVDAGFHPGEAVRLRAAGVFPHKAAGYTRGGIRRIDAIVAWDRAGWQPSDAARQAAAGFPGPAWPVTDHTPPNRARYDSMSALVADSFSEADHRAGRAVPAPPSQGGMVAVAGRAWDGSPTVAAAAYQPATLPGFAIAGASADTERAVRDRVRAALINSGLQWPAGRITVTVTGDLDSRSDAAIAAAVASCSGQIAPPPGELWGEIGLDGTIRDIEH